MAVVLALCSSLCWGVGDFLGGRVASRSPALTVTVGTQAFGLLVVLVLAPLLGGVASTSALVLGAGAGVVGGIGLVVYFRALAMGPMGLVAPLAGAVGALVPVTAGLVDGEEVGPLALLGIVAGLGAVVLATMDPASRPASRPRRSGREIVTGGPALAVLAGLAFGVFFVALDRTPTDSGLWPLVGARVASVGLLGLVAVARRRPLPARSDVPTVAASGVLDSAANALFLLATRSGLLALTGLLSSLYPVVIVVLARQVLGERLARVQVVGVALALVAVVLVALP